MKVRVSGILVIGLALVIQVPAQPSPSPSPTPVKVSENELKKSTEKFSEELDKTKKESSAALEESKKPKTTKAKTSLSSVSVTVRRVRRRAKQENKPVIVQIQKTVETSQGSPTGEIIPRPIIPVEKVEGSSVKRTGTNLSVKKKKMFWQKVWHILPFRFFGEH
jgi:hypothetical protein